MNWELDRRTMQMTPKKRSGVEVSARQGGIMVEDFDRNIEFLINYGTSRIIHTFGCTPDNIKLFNMSDARKIADKIKRLGSGRGIDPEFMDFRTYLINSNFSMRTFSSKNLEYRDRYVKDQVNYINKCYYVKSSDGWMSNDAGNINITTINNHKINIDYYYDREGGHASLEVDGKLMDFDINDFRIASDFFSLKWILGIIYKYCY